MRNTDKSCEELDVHPRTSIDISYRRPAPDVAYKKNFVILEIWLDAVQGGKYARKHLP